MEEINDMLIETPIDKLIKLVKEKERITIAEVAKTLGATETQVEDWVRILEERDFVELRYPTIGEPLIILKRVTDAKINQKEKKFEKEKEKIEKKTEKFEEKVTETEKKIEMTDKEVSELEKELHKRIEGVEANLKILDSLEAKKQEIVSDTKEIEQKTEGVVKNFEGVKADIEEIDKKINDKIKFIDEHGNQIKDLEALRQEIRKDIENLDAEIKLTKLVFKGKSANPPSLNPLRRLFQKHEERHEKIKEKHEELHKKVSDIKQKTEKKKNKVKKKSAYGDFW